MIKNKLFKGLLLTLICTAIGTGVKAESIDSIIKKSPIDKTSTIAVSVKKVKTGKTVYEYNQNKLMNPASALKPFTMKPAYDTLGADFTFKTSIYKDSQNNLYLKLSGDPTLTFKDLKELLSKYDGPVKDVIVDASANDYLEWGIGWMWDDDASTYFPKYSQYTINGNTVQLELSPGIDGKPPSIRNRSPYQMQIINMLTNSDSTHIKYSRMPWHSGDMTLIEGTISGPANIYLPVDSTERHFMSTLKEALARAHVKYKGVIKKAPVPDNAKLVEEHESVNLENLIGATLKNSINLNTELIFKAAGAKYANAQGTTINGIKMFDKYYADVNKKTQKPLIVDACGASRNDLITADWMSEALIKIALQDNFDKYETLFAKPIEGTLSDRLLNISRFVRAKTGSISGASSLTGYVTAKSGEKYAFAILIQNFNQPVSEIKALEDKIVNALYLN